MSGLERIGQVVKLGTSRLLASLSSRVPRGEMHFKFLSGAAAGTAGTAAQPESSREQ